MIVIESFFLARKGGFVNVRDAVDSLAPEYVEGYIELTVGYVPLLDSSFLDYIDSLWVYIARMVGDLSRMDEVSTNFPDQPVELRFCRVGNGKLRLSVDSNKRKRVAYAGEIEFTSALRKSGKLFFDKLSELSPKQAGVCDMALKSLLSTQNGGPLF